MFRNNYDNDSVTYSPTGRLFQVEYALEAIKQGSAAVGLTSNDYVVLVALKRNAEELGSYQKKIIKLMITWEWHWLVWHRMLEFYLIF